LIINFMNRMTTKKESVPKPGTDSFNIMPEQK